VAGLAERGVDLGGAVDVIGTSAGSVVGTWITSGRDLAQAAASQADSPPLESASGQTPDVALMTRAFACWASIESYSPGQGSELGAIARELDGQFEPFWVEAMARQLETESWPSALRVSVTDTHSGAISLFGADSAVPLERAVAASCAVPAVFPTVNIDGCNYMDGAIATGTHAQRALEREPEAVLIVATFDERTPGIGGLMQRELDAEVAGLRDAGVRVAVICPSKRAGEIVRDPMNPAGRPAAVKAGLEQGRSEAARLEDWQR